MRLNGVWIGWGLGDWSHNHDGTDKDSTVRRFRDYARRMFRSYAGGLADNNKFDQELYLVVQEMQQRYVADGKLALGLYVPGVLDLPTQEVSGYRRVSKILPIIFTVEGHMSNPFVGPAAFNAETLQNQGVCRWKPYYYVNNDVPFHNKQPILDLANMIGQKQVEGPIINGRPLMWDFNDRVGWGIIGFSRGAMITSDLMSQHVLQGSLAWRLPTFKRGLALGNPRREFGKCAPWADNPPPANTGGIMDRLFVTTGTAIQDRWAENANAGDMFAQNTKDSTGLMKTTIARIITEGSFFGGQAAVFARVLAFFGNPTGELFADIKAAYEAIRFLATNPNPHYTTVAEPGDIEWMRGVAR